MRKTVMAIAAAGLFIGTAAQADISIDARQANQQRQIDAGGRSGKLSRRERTVLTTEQHQIKRQEAAYARSGTYFSAAEERAVNRLLDRSQAHINRLKNNRERGRGEFNI